jgi:hypothetical protein
MLNPRAFLAIHDMCGLQLNLWDSEAFSHLASNPIELSAGQFVLYRNRLCILELCIVSCSKFVIDEPAADNRPASGTRYQRACTTRMAVFWPGIFFILKTMMFHAVTTVLNERAHLKMVIRSVADSVSLSLGRTERQGPTALHRAQQVDLLCL